MSESDAVDRIVEQWARELPELNLESMETFGRVHRVSAKLSRRLQRAHADFGIGRGEFDVLASLRRSGAPYVLSPKQIGAHLMLTSGGLTGRLDRLERAEFVERSPDPDDRRGVKIRLTEAGKVAVEGAVRAGLDVTSKALAALDAEERTQLATLLRKLHSAFEDQPLDLKRPGPGPERSRTRARTRPRGRTVCSWSATA